MDLPEIDSGEQFPSAAGDRDDKKPKQAINVL